MSGGRGAGQTLAMVRDLPDAECVVIVHAHPFRNYVMRMIADVRGIDMLKRCRVVAVTDMHSADRLLAGESRAAFVDHAFWYLAEPRVAGFVSAWLERHGRKAA